MAKDIIIGSRALKYHGVTLRPVNDFTDIDLITMGEPNVDTVYRIEYLNSPALYSLLLPHCDSMAGTNLLVPSVQALYTLKLAHMNRNHEWKKHLDDLIELRKQGIEPNYSLFRYLYDFWASYYPLKPINLNKEPDDFFNMVTPHIHEQHHEYFKLGNKPAYKHILRDDHKIMVDEAKFKAMNQEEQFNTFWEESMVIAFERQLPLIKGMQKVLCDLSKGFWNRHMVFHLVQLMEDFPNKNSLFVSKANFLKENYEKLVN